MPSLSVVTIRAALVYLFVGFTFGGLLLANKGIPLAGWIWSLLSAHVEFVLLGWTAQLILGVAFWILPRFSGGSRGNERLAWGAVGLLNAGILLVAAQALFAGLAFLLPVGRLLEGLAAVSFAFHAWGRIRPTYK